MAITWVGGTTLVTVASGTSVSANLPSGLQDGDLLLAFVFARSAITPPAGWTEVVTTSTYGSAQRFAAYKKDTVSSGDSGASLSFTQASSGRMGVVFAAARGGKPLVNHVLVSTALNTNYAISPPVISSNLSNSLFIVAASPFLTATSGSVTPTESTGATLFSGSVEQNRIAAFRKSASYSDSYAGSINVWPAGSPGDTTNSIGAITILVSEPAVAAGFQTPVFGTASAVTDNISQASGFSSSAFGGALAVVDTVGSASGFSSSTFGAATFAEFPSSGFATTQFGQHTLEMETPPWTPALITTQLWLDAADASTFTLSGASVDQWRDKSGNARHAEQSSETNKPAIASAEQNGRDVIRFDGTNDRLYSASSSAIGSNASALNCFVVRKYSASASANGSVFGQYLPGSATFESCRIYRNSSGKSAAFFARTTSGATVTSTSDASGWEIVSWHADMAANELVARTGGASIGAGSVPGSGNTSSGNSTFQIGCRANSLDFFNGDVAEIVYVGALTASDRQRVEGYLAHKWGITATLPADHPYKVDAPLDAFPAAGVSSTAFGQAIAGTDQTLSASSYQSSQFGTHTIVPQGVTNITAIVFVPWSPKTRFGIAQIGYVDAAFDAAPIPSTTFGAPISSPPSTEIAAGPPATYHGILTAIGFSPSAFGMPVGRYDFTASASAFKSSIFGGADRVVAQIATRIKTTRFGRAQATVDVVGSGRGFKSSRFGRPYSASDRTFIAKSLSHARFGQAQQATLGASGFSRTRFGVPTADYDATLARGFSYSRFGHATLIDGAFSADGFSDSTFGEPSAQVSHVALHIWSQSRFGTHLMKRAA